MSRFRSQPIPEIQGLRAVAVLAVLIYHIWPKVLPGGYVGVDVFFVISGYLITGSLFAEFETTGRISIPGFYARRIRRLLPAATLVSLTVALCIPLFPRAQWADLANSIVASALYGQNWYLAAQAVDYLADDAKGPMNHFWSLSVEEQYYIVWPLLLLPLLRLARRTAWSPRAVFGCFVGLVGAASLIHSILLTPLNPGVAYFATTTRAWELALGGALAVFQARRALPERRRAALGLLGLAAIAAASLSYSDGTAFPGFAALLPTLGAGAIIVSSGAPAPWSARPVLASRPFRYCGDISYSLYLWHWPLIVVYGVLTGHPPGLRGGAALLLAAWGLAHVSKIAVEDTFRSARVPVGRTLAAGVAGVGLTVAVGLGYALRESDDPGVVAGGLPRGALAMLDPHYDWRKEDLARALPRPEKARKDVPSAYANKCHQSQSGTEVLTCDFGNPNSRVKIVLVGDSHATHWFPAFEELARRRPVYVRGVAKSACLFSLEPVYNEALKRPYAECVEWSRNVVDWLARERPNLILISQTPLYGMASVEGSAAAWKRLIEMGLNIQAIRSTPFLSIEPAKCFETSKDWKVDCVSPRTEAFKQDPTLATAEFLNVPALDFSEYFCNNIHCPAVIGGMIVYRDTNHMTATFARTLEEPTEKKILIPLIHENGFDDHFVLD